ncbi:phage tail assembly protein T [Pseudomonas syringae]|uniref:phage tail assembly protein T n=1 Tax=Pseudomonas syringae group TaxID=136849 RepID=UPI003F7AE896
MAEAKANLSYTEALDWMDFEQSNGSLDVGERLDHGFALASMMVNWSAGGKAKYSDFLPKHGQAEEEQVEDDPQAALQLLTKMFKAGQPA